MERTNTTVESKLHELTTNAQSWQAHENEWTMPLSCYNGILSNLTNLYKRERKTAFEMFKAVEELLEYERADHSKETAQEIADKTDKLRNALTEKKYVYARSIGEIDYGHAEDNFEFHGGKLLFKNKEEMYNGEVRYMTLEELLESINADHSDEWTEYDKNDWREGMNEWTDWEIVKW